MPVVGYSLRMTYFDRSRTRTWAARLAALFTGVWLFAALTPCVMAMDHPCGMMDGGKICAPVTDPCGLAAVDCQMTDSNPPSAATADLPAPMPVVLATLPAADPLTPARIRHRARADSDLPDTLRLLQHVRLLI
jgi:hypothetical protein